MINFIRDSPKRLRIFEKIQEHDANALRSFCPTRWILRESALTSVLQNYTEVVTFMNEISGVDRGEAGAKAAGFSHQLEKFPTYFVLKSLSSCAHQLGLLVRHSNLRLCIWNMPSRFWTICMAYFKCKVADWSAWLTAPIDVHNWITI